MQIDEVFEELLAKMEVLSVQNHYQGQYGVIGSGKGRDWTSPLTLPPPPSSGQHQHYHHQLHANAASSKTSDRTNEVDSGDAFNRGNESDGGSGQHEPDDVDVVDGRMPQLLAQHSPQHQHFYHHNQHTHQHFYHHQQHQQQQQQQQQQQEQQRKDIHLNYEKMEDITKATSASGGKNVYATTTYNNNLFYCDPSPADDVTSPTMAEVHFGVPASSDIDEIDEAMVHELSQRLQEELRAAKSRHLDCTEVSLPCYLTPRIAAEIIKTSEREPCGVRGCSIFIEFEDEPNNTRRIASFKVDPDTVSTFELYLTLKQDRSGWISLIPQFIRNLTRSSTILISPDFTLTKNKLYSCE